MTSTEADQDPARIIRELREKVSQLEGEVEAAADMAAEAAAELAAEVAESDKHDDTIRAALVSLHEQAHGNYAIHMCLIEPCCSIDAGYAGPAPLALIP